MKIKELVGKDIMMAYDGNYLSRDFGYSCANFNVKTRGFGSGAENTPDTFDFYTKNIKNISCMVAYNNANKICGRRMFFKGKSLINDDIFNSSVKRGTIVKYLYGYYGSQDRTGYDLINKYVMDKYSKGAIHTDNSVLVNGINNKEIGNYFIMQVEKADYNKFPPIDILFVCPELKALANFKPKKYILEVLRDDYKRDDFDEENLEFHQAYRFSPNEDRGGVGTSYKTWLDNYKLKNDVLPGGEEND